ncbi:hypothetical protein ACFCV8_27035 [Streptomyces sp. NPDC056347]|uniref:hypothetical protein n=1 Tax=Streptomyces sp. NPDC056347 TaxID=3345790 RepID=UPI0035D84D87
MQRTRITVSLLVGMAAATMSGCVSVAPGPDAPPLPHASGPAQELSPQIVLPPVHDTLEALPLPEPSTPRPSSAASHRAATGAPPGTRRPHTPWQQWHPATTRPQPRPHAVPPAVTVPVPVPRPPASGTGICALGRGYGHWPAGSPQSRICDDTYGH